MEGAGERNRRSRAKAHLYQQAGFRKTEEKTHPLWGQVLSEERYDLPL